MKTSGKDLCLLVRNWLWWWKNKHQVYPNPTSQPAVLELLVSAAITLTLSSQNRKISRVQFSKYWEINLLIISRVRTTPLAHRFHSVIPVSWENSTTNILHSCSLPPNAGRFRAHKCSASCWWNGWMMTWGRRLQEFASLQRQGRQLEHFVRPCLASGVVWCHRLGYFASQSGSLWMRLREQGPEMGSTAPPPTFPSSFLNIGTRTRDQFSFNQTKNSSRFLKGIFWVLCYWTRSWVTWGTMASGLPASAGHGFARCMGLWAADSHGFMSFYLYRDCSHTSCSFKSAGVGEVWFP